ncbi:MAG: ISL3 family transposase [Firmicutes bacterium]|nr:ISL3 family transposase [Bacillota bacterium]
MKNDIIKFLDLKGSDIEITDIQINQTNCTKKVYLEHKLSPHFCPNCSYRMHSIGPYIRTVNHPILQDGLALKLVLKQRRWKCQNIECGLILTDHFSFVEKYRRNTNMSDILIVDAFRDAEMTVSQIAGKFNVSPSHALNTFLRYVDMPKRQLTEAISVDEVFLGMGKDKKYALIIMDFITGEPIDMVQSRRKADTLPYFSNIPKKERDKVKYLISDMYRPYAKYIDDYFHNAVHIVDSFHVISLINRKFDAYMRSVQRKIAARDRENHERLEQELGRRIDFTPSREYYLLKHYRWTILKSEKNLKSFGWKYDTKLRKEMSLTDYQNALYAIDPNFKEMQRLKDKYIRFNDKYAGNPKAAVAPLRLLISEYRNSGFVEFEELAATLTEFFDPIINSFIMVERLNVETGRSFTSRLSNGPIEAVNRIIKDMKRNARGYQNFNNIRNRFLFSQRANAAVLAVPKTLKQIELFRGNSRTVSKSLTLKRKPKGKIITATKRRIKRNHRQYVK